MTQALDQKQKALAFALAQIEKAHGKGSVMRLGDGPIKAPNVISTGAMSLDIALGIGGYPTGRIIELFGPESSGKTTLALHAIAESQRHGGTCAFIDAEHAFDANYARKIGIKTDELLLSQPDYGEQALEIAESLIRSGAVDLVVVDSVAALTPKAEIEGEMGDSIMGVQARLMSQALRKLTGIVNKSHACIIFVNQIREKIGVMFGNPEVTPGGRALKFFSSLRIDVRRIETLKSGTDMTGIKVRVKVVKNKLAPPFKLAEFDIMFGEGISTAGDLLDLAVKHELITKSGTWFSIGEQRLGQGREVAKKFLVDNPDIMTQIQDEIASKFSLGKPKQSATASDADSTNE